MGQHIYHYLYKNDWLIKNIQLFGKQHERESDAAK